MEWDTKVVKCIGPIRSMKLHDTVLCNEVQPSHQITLSCIIQPFLSTFGIEFEGERKIESQFPRHQHANHHLLWYFKYQFEINKSQQIHTFPYPKARWLHDHLPTKGCYQLRVKHELPSMLHVDRYSVMHFDHSLVTFKKNKLCNSSGWWGRVLILLVDKWIMLVCKMSLLYL